MTLATMRGMCDLRKQKKSGPTENRTQAARFKVLCANQLHYRTGSLVRLPLSRTAYLLTVGTTLTAMLLFIGFVLLVNQFQAKQPSSAVMDLRIERERERERQGAVLLWR
jgi:hypothetical protein